MRSCTLFIVAFLILVSTFHLTTACVYNSECKKDNRCISGVCVPEECRVNLDCITRGIYFKCSNSRCIPDKHKLCRTDDDCKKNVRNKKCSKNKCT